MAQFLLKRLNFLCCLTVHFQFIVHSLWIENLLQVHASQTIVAIIGITYLLYPLCGWMTEVFFDSFKVIKWSFIALLLSSIATAILGVILLSYSHVKFGYWYGLPGGLAFIAGLIGLGMYESNAIQFGIDQMMDASSEHLSSFIHWYFWCAHVGPLLLFYLFVTLGFSNEAYFCQTTNKWRFSLHFIGLCATIVSCIQTLLLCIIAIVINVSQRFLHVEPMSRNSLKLLYQVIKYSYNHRYPVRRSALSYWENETPSRIDLGKDKYGGPFTYEQVEDVKTFFRLLSLMGSLFGFFLLGDGFSITEYVMKQSSCPSVIPFVIAYLNPQHITLLVALTGVPLLHGLSKVLPQYVPSLLSRLWIGLYLGLIAAATQTLLSLLIKANYDPLICYQTLNEFSNNVTHSYFSRVTSCSFFHLSNALIGSSNCTQYGCPNIINPDNTVYVFILPLFMYGISYLLVFMTMLEFICAQAPNSMKGLLIGLWYSMLSIKYGIIYTLDTLFLGTVSWYIYNLFKGVGIFISIIMFSFACKRYRFRERNEVVNYQNMIEEQYERELLLENDIQGDYCSSDEEISD